MAFTGLKAAGGSWGGQTPSGTIGDQRFGQNKLFEPEKTSGLGWPSPASRLMEGPGGARHHQGPSGINALVKTNCLSRKKFPALDGLHRPQGCWRVLGGGQTPSGTIRDQRFGQNEPFEPEKISDLGWPSPASRPLEGPGGPDNIRDHGGSTLWSKRTV